MGDNKLTETAEFVGLSCLMILAGVFLFVCGMGLYELVHG